jgi:hypothetical protein
VLVLPALPIEVVRKGFGELEGEAEPRRAKRAARSDGGLCRVATFEIEGLVELEEDFSKLMDDFLRAFRRARRSSSWSDIRVWQVFGGRIEFFYEEFSALRIVCTRVYYVDKM